MTNKIYAVAIGRETGIFDSWSVVKPLVEGVSGAKYKSFPSDERDLAMAFIDNKPAQYFDEQSVCAIFCHIQECTLSFYNKGLIPKAINDIGGFIAFFVNKDKVGDFKYNKRVSNQFEAWAYVIYQAVEHAIKISTKEQLLIYTPSPSSFTVQSRNKKANNWIKKAEKLARDNDRKIDVRVVNKTNNPCAFYFNEGTWRK